MDEQTNQNTQDESQIEGAQAQTTSINDLEKKCEEYLDGWKRAKADLINYKKDEAKRFENFLKFANEQMLRDSLIVLDSFDLAIISMGGESKVEKGIFLIRAQFEDVLKKYGLERLIVSVGNPFDPALQEAIATVESDQASGNVVEEVEKGYMLNGKLLRPARVKVAK